MIFTILMALLIFFFAWDVFWFVKWYKLQIKHMENEKNNKLIQNNSSLESIPIEELPLIQVKYQDYNSEETITCDIYNENDLENCLTTLCNNYKKCSYEELFESNMKTVANCLLNSIEQTTPNILHDGMNNHIFLRANKLKQIANYLKDKLQNQNFAYLNDLPEVKQ